MQWNNPYFPAVQQAAVHPTRKVAQLLDCADRYSLNRTPDAATQNLLARILSPGDVAAPLEIMHDYLTYTGDTRGAKLAEMMLEFAEEHLHRQQQQPNNAVSVVAATQSIMGPPVVEEDDWALDKLDIERVTAEDLKHMPLSKEFTQGYLRLSEVKTEYVYEYHNCWNEQVKEYFEMLMTQKAVGIDTEFHLRNSKATYLQLSTPEKGLILNIRNYRFRDQEEFKDAIKKLFENKEILKVGLNLSCDTRVLKQAFFGEIDFYGAYSLDKELFTIPTNGIALSTLCHRVFGKPLNKDCQAWIGEQEELDDDEQKEYAIMDALTPIVLYDKLRHALESQLDRREFYVNCLPRDQMDVTEVLLDQPLDLMRQFLDQVKVRYSFVRDYTYESRFPD